MHHSVPRGLTTWPPATKFASGDQGAEAVLLRQARAPPKRPDRRAAAPPPGTARTLLLRTHPHKQQARCHGRPDPERSRRRRRPPSSSGAARRPAARVAAPCIPPGALQRPPASCRRLLPGSSTNTPHRHPSAVASDPCCSIHPSFLSAPFHPNYYLPDTSSASNLPDCLRALARL